MSRTSSARRFAIPVISALVAIAAVLCLSGCAINIVRNSEPPALGENTLKSGSTLTDGKLLVGINASNAPFGGENGEGAIVGLDADIAAAIGDQLGVKVELVDVGTKGRGAITNGTVDIVLGATKSGSNSDISYTDAYLNNGVSLYALNENKPESIADIDFEKTKVIVVSGTESASSIEEALDKKLIIEADSIEAAFEALATEEAPFLAVDAAAGDYIARGKDNISRVGFISAADIMPVYALVSKDNADLYAAVNNSLKVMIDNGTMQVILSKWLGNQGYNLLPGNISLDDLPDKFTAGKEEEEETAENAEGTATEGEGQTGTTTAQAAN